MPALLVFLPATITTIGCAYTLVAALLIGRWRNENETVPRRKPGPGATNAASAAPGPGLSPGNEGLPSITMLKPLYGAEPGLAAKLARFLDQDYPGPIQMICGIARADDPAANAVPAAAELVIDPTRHGSNAKVSNLVNMARAATGDVLILSDSDMIVPRDYAAQVVATLSQPGVGAVTLPYAGQGEAGGWSRLAAAGISWGFLPGVAVGVATGLARPCMGSTIALRRETLDAIGGFARFADLLADDHAIGAAVRELGLAVVVVPPIVIHSSTETSLAALIRHELRWNATVRMLDPAGYAGSLVTFPLAWAVIAGFAGTGWWPAAAALACRLLLAERVDRLASARTAPLWWLPARDLLSFGLHVAGLFTRRVDWRGQRLHMAAGGRVTAETEIPG